MIPLYRYISDFTKYIYEISRIGKFVEIKQNRNCHGLRGGKNGELLSNGSIISVWDDENALEIDTGDG